MIYQAPGRDDPVDQADLIDGCPVPSLEGYAPDAQNPSPSPGRARPGHRPDADLRPGEPQDDRGDGRRRAGGPFPRRAGPHQAGGRPGPGPRGSCLRLVLPARQQRPRLARTDRRPAAASHRPARRAHLPLPARATSGPNPAPVPRTPRQALRGHVQPDRPARTLRNRVVGPCRGPSRPWLLRLIAPSRKQARPPRSGRPGFRVWWPGQVYRRESPPPGPRETPSGLHP